ncbi:hypothetical protein MJH12_20075, partial [bacterium]|nr:hypothetical protein [bacterium]
MEFLYAPEFLTALLALLILMSDFFIIDKRKDIIPIITIIGATLILAISFAFPLIGQFNLFTSLFNNFDTSYGKFITYSCDQLSVFGSRFLLVSLILCSLMSWDYLGKRTIKITEYYVLLTFATSAFMFMVSSQELLTFFVSLETASLCLYALC